MLPRRGQCREIPNLKVKKPFFPGIAQRRPGVQPPHVQEDGEEEAGQEGQVQDTARHLHGDQGGDGDDVGQIFTPA